MLNPPAFLEPLLNTPVAVFGGGVSGRGIVALVERLGLALAKSGYGQYLLGLLRDPVIG